MSFVLAIVSTGLVFAISAERLYMVFVTQFFYALTFSFHYLPQDIAIMDKNSSSQMNKYYGLNAALTLIVATLSPFISGYLMQYCSYYILLIVVIICAAICFVFSFNIKNFCKSEQRMNFKKYFVEVNKIKPVRIGFWAYGLFKFSQCGVIDIILSILILIKTGGSFSVGLYSALATLLSGVILILYVYFCKRKKFAIWICTILLSLSSILLIFWSELICFFIYFFVKKISFQILRNSIFSNVFTCTNGTNLGQFRIAQRMLCCVYNRPLVILSYCLALLIYNFVSNEISLSIILVALTLTQIISTSLFVLSEKQKCSFVEQEKQIDETTMN